MPQPEPGHRPPAASPPPPRGQSRHPSPSPRPSSASPPQARSCGTPEPPRSVTSTRITPPAARTATVTVSPAALEPLCRTLLANSSLTTSAAPYSPGCPGPGTPAVNARATRACSARPPSRSPGQPPWPPADPPCPARPAARETTRGRSRAHGDARPARRPASSPGYAAGAARPWPSVKQPTVRTDRDEGTNPVRYASVDTATRRPAVTHRDTWRDKNKTAPTAAFPQPGGRFRRWWQVLGSNQRRLSRRFYRPLSFYPSQTSLTSGYVLRDTFLAAAVRYTSVRPGFQKATDRRTPDHGRPGWERLR